MVGEIKLQVYSVLRIHLVNNEITIISILHKIPKNLLENLISEDTRASFVSALFGASPIYR